jgi:hypothetical protein
LCIKTRNTAGYPYPACITQEIKRLLCKTISFCWAINENAAYAIVAIYFQMLIFEARVADTHQFTIAKARNSSL